MFSNDESLTEIAGLIRGVVQQDSGNAQSSS